MKYGYAEATAPTKISSHLQQGVEVNGEVKFSEILKVDTRLTGHVISDTGCLLVSEGGHVEATVQAGYVEVFGTVEGNITAKHKVDIHASGRVYGDIQTPVLNIEPGALFEGRCHMADENLLQEQKKSTKPTERPADAVVLQGKTPAATT